MNTITAAATTNHCRIRTTRNELRISGRLENCRAQQGARGIRKRRETRVRHPLLSLYPLNRVVVTPAARPKTEGVPNRPERPGSAAGSWESSQVLTLAIDALLDVRRGRDLLH